MVERIKDVMAQAGASWVLWLLFALSVLSIAVMIERAIVFLKVRDDVTRLVGDLHEYLGVGDLRSADARLRKSASIEAAVARAGLSQWERGARAVEEAMAAASGIERARLEKRLMFLGTLGNNAPFIGLLGTVIGVVGAFEELGRGTASAASGLAPERVMGTIAEALVATAVGILVAIPAVAVFNYFQGLVAAAVSGAETLGHVVLTHVPSDPGLRVVAADETPGKTFAENVNTSGAPAHVASEARG